ncbi:hypothetical protein COCNU_03G002250 [Cocos nucifera]|uniref:DNA/RNA-binding protein Alba-like domain-containing protein n=1 Tax=Cocos nucifera TaxID=13894 RepID=A0A8K0MYL3_COCNU|nr:hypothetical protein COCNU_03G002250 [Cocos nucifera]
MEAVMVAEAVKDPTAAAAPPPPPSKKNRIQVSTNKKPLYFYVNLAKRYMQQHNEIELSALGMAIGTVVTVAEILKNNGLATEKKILTSTVGTKDETRGRLVRKAKIEILLGKTENSSDAVTAAKVDDSKAANEDTKEESEEETKKESEEETNKKESEEETDKKESNEETKEETQCTLCQLLVSLRF